MTGFLFFQRKQLSLGGGLCIHFLHLLLHTRAQFIVAQLAIAIAIERLEIWGIGIHPRLMRLAQRLQLLILLGAQSAILIGIGLAE